MSPAAPQRLRSPGARSELRPRRTASTRWPGCCGRIRGGYRNNPPPGGRHPGGAVAERGGHFRHAIAKNVFSMLDNFTWWQVIRMLRERHHWRWKDVRRRFTTPPGGGRRSRRATSSCGGSRRSRSPGTATAAARSPIPGSSTSHDGRCRGEPVALRSARRVRRAAWRNGPAATLEPRSRPTQRSRSRQGSSEARQAAAAAAVRRSSRRSSRRSVSDSVPVRAGARGCGPSPRTTPVATAPRGYSVG
jgi:hypothetical protein